MSQVKIFMHHTGPDAEDTDPEQVKKFKEYLKSMVRLKFNADKVQVILSCNTGMSVFVHPANGRLHATIKDYVLQLWDSGEWW